MGPDFIGIGGHKCASTWLWYVLNRHPDIWLPLRKELHYFDRSDCYPSPTELGTPRLIDRLFGSTESCIRWRKIASRDLAAALIKRDWSRLQWALKFYSGEYNDDWYLNLFKQSGSQLRGEITPAYSMLSARDFGHIRSLLPAVKIIYLLRDPVARGWSHIRFDAGTHRIENINDWQEVRRFIDSPMLTRRGDYLATLDALESVFTRSQVFIGFYDDIENRPAEFLDSLSNFLGVNNAGFAAQAANRRIGGSQVKAIPDHVHRYLAEKYLDSLRTLEIRLGGPVSEWRDKAEQTLSR